MTSPLLAWLDAPRADAGVRYATDAGWELRSYDELASAVRTAAAQIASVRQEERPVAAIVVRRALDFTAAYFGALLAGCTPCPIAPPGSFQRLDGYRDHLSRLLAVARPGIVIADADLAPLLPDRPRLHLDLSAADGPFEPLPPAELALLQFTSGSSGTPKGARVPWAKLERAMQITGASFRLDASSHYVSWLPLYHDMGLIAGMLLPVTRQCPLSSMTPEQFVRKPIRFLECLGRDGGTHTATPTFGFSYSVRRVRPEALEGLDFTSWRRASVGAERVGAAPLYRFARLLAPHGFDPKAFAPGFGMAEATLQVTGAAWGDEPDAIRAGNLRFGAAVDGERLPLMRAGARDDAAEWLVSSGRPVGGFELRVVAEDKTALPDRHLGELVVRGPTVVDGYEGGAPDQLTSFDGDELHTGDAAFLVDGEVFVVGRMGDAVSIRGRSVYLEDVETQLKHVPGVPFGRCVVIGGGQRVVALVEAEPGPWVDEARAVVVRQCGTDAEVEIRCARRGTILRTTSGKPRRRTMWQQLAEGSLGGTPVA